MTEDRPEQFASREDAIAWFRTNAPGEAVFLCGNCEHIWSEGAAFAWGDVDGITFRLLSVCRFCGREYAPLDFSTTQDPIFGSLVTFGAPAIGQTPAAHQAQIREVIEGLVEELSQLPEHASIDQILSVLDQQGRPQMTPVVDYLRAHHLELAALGLSLVAVVIALLTWLAPRAADNPPPVPDGITKDQMERLIDDLESTHTGPSAPQPQEDGAPREKQRQTGAGHPLRASDEGGGEE